MAVRATPQSLGYVEKALTYARGVVGGLISAGQWVVKACQRQLDDLERQRTGDFPYYFDVVQAERPCQFIEQLKHVKDGGEAREGDLIALQAWQCFILCCIFGWLQAVNGLRRFREAYLEIPRKNGKSLIAAGIGLFMFTMDGVRGAEVYSGATTEKQAWEVFRPAKAMAEKCEDLLDASGIVVNAKSLSTSHDLSTFAPLIGKPGDGASPSCAILDEFHEHDTPDQYETMETGMGARRQPLMLVITTAGTNVAGPCYDKHLACQKILDGVLPDERVFCIMFGIDLGDENAGDGKEKGDDWTSPAVLQKANPNYGVSVFADYLIAQQRKALFNPAAQQAFKTKHLNVWGGARMPWMPMHLWDQCADTELRLEEFIGKPYFGVLDLASKDDIAAYTKIFVKMQKVKDKTLAHYYTFAKYYVPTSQLWNKDNPNAAAYQKWQALGLLTATEGDEIDFDVIEEDVKADKSIYQLRELLYDPYRATQLAQHMKKANVMCIEVRQTVPVLSAPMKETLSAVKGKRMHHDGNAVTKWMVSNVTCKTDAKDNIFPRKERDQMKIDGAVAIIMGMVRASLGLQAGLDDWLTKPVTVKR